MPPTRRKTTTGSDRAASTRPRSALDPVRSRTANASATFANALPTNEVVRPRKRRRKSRRPSGPARRRSINGAEGDRTPDLRHAMAALSQLSYGPLLRAKCSREVEIVCPINSPPLVVQTGAQPEMNGWTALDSGYRDQKASVQFYVVGGDCVDLVRGVGAPDETLSGAAS